jgi:sphinganine-1-phosphate aldolase
VVVLRLFWLALVIHIFINNILLIHIKKIPAYRNLASKKGVRKPEIIVCQNAHVGFFKAAKLLGMRAIRIRTNNRHEANIGAIKRAIGRETCMIVASAPAFVNGVIDNIEEISQVNNSYAAYTF